MNRMLSKGESVTLAGRTGGGVGEILMSLGWDTIKRPALSGTVKQIAVDLDASAIIISADREVMEIVYYGHLSTVNNSIRHTGDNLTGRGDAECIVVDLANVPPTVAHIIFVVSSYSGQDFSQIENATARVIDCTDGSRELARYEFSGLGSHTAILMAQLSRSGLTWMVTALGLPGHAQTPEELVPLALESLW